MFSVRGTWVLGLSLPPLAWAAHHRVRRARTALDGGQPCIPEGREQSRVRAPGERREAVS